MIPPGAVRTRLGTGVYPEIVVVPVLRLPRLRSIPPWEIVAITCGSGARIGAPRPLNRLFRRVGRR